MEIKQVKYMKEIMEFDYASFDCLIKQISYYNENNNDYFTFNITDGEKEVELHLFKEKETVELFETLLESNNYLNYQNQVKKLIVYKTKKGYLNIKGLEDSNKPLSEFIPTAPYEGEEMYQEMITILKQYSDTNWKNSVSELCFNILEENKAQLLIHSAAYSMHHNMVGGLLYHTLWMLKAVVKYFDLYDVDKEIMVVGCILHDIGKLKEMDTSPLGEVKYTVSGNLENHLSIGLSMVEIENYKNNYQYDQERVELVKHLIASHHGRLEYGAIQLPKTPEAFLLSAIDNIDAKMYMFYKALEDVEPGENSLKIIRGLDVRVYKPKGKKSNF